MIYRGNEQNKSVNPRIECLTLNVVFTVKAVIVPQLTGLSCTFPNED